MSRRKRTSKNIELIVMKEGRIEAKRILCFKNSVKWEMISQNRSKKRSFGFGNK